LGQAKRYILKGFKPDISYSFFLIEEMNKEKICLNEVTDRSFNDERLYQPQWNATEWPRQAGIPQGQAE